MFYAWKQRDNMFTDRHCTKVMVRLFIDTKNKVASKQHDGTNRTAVLSFKLEVLLQAKIPTLDGALVMYL